MIADSGLLAGLGPMPVMALRDQVIVPGWTVPLFVGRRKSIRAIEAAWAGDRTILLFTQVDPGDDAPGFADLHENGTLGRIEQTPLALPDGNRKVLVTIARRVRLVGLDEAGEMLVGRAALRKDLPCGEDVPVKVAAVKERFAAVAVPEVLSRSMAERILSVEDPAQLADQIAIVTEAGVEQYAKFLGTDSVADRLAMCAEWMETWSSRSTNVY